VPIECIFVALMRARFAFRRHFRKVFRNRNVQAFVRGRSFPRVYSARRRLASVRASCRDTMPTRPRVSRSRRGPCVSMKLWVPLRSRECQSRR
jgi:hypothetical protein